MKITQELFVIPDGKNFILLLPIKGIIMRVNSGVIKLLQDFQKGKPIRDRGIGHQLQKWGILVKGKEKSQKPLQPISDFKPTSVTLFPTSDCNLRCIYCYGDGGDNQYYMPWEVAKATVDLLITNALTKKEKIIDIGFHGGGEPFWGKSWLLVQRIVQYGKITARRNKLKINFSAGTNGVLPPSKLGWLVKNFNRLTVSLDGPADIQNRQRPKKSGEPTFTTVVRTIKFLEKHHFNYELRATITEESCSRMMEVLDLFKKISTCKSFSLEPLFECGRCRTSKVNSSRPQDFSRKFVEVLEYAKQFGIALHYAGVKSGSVANRFCGAAGENFCVTLLGDITSCFEVSLPTDTRKDVFFYGRYNPATALFKFDYDRLNYLRSRVVENLPHCKNCFAKYSCAGDCLAKAYDDNQGDIMETLLNTRCEINRNILFHQIDKVLSQRAQSLKNYSAGSVCNYYSTKIESSASSKINKSKGI
jgi:uncharacterized protein